ncbi:hypothetical protein KFU94_13010 [Chloroflexi bacterium TSY]|nr:hypothetical protein [Chloroflexi bacterium TSY]
MIKRQEQEPGTYSIRLSFEGGNAEEKTTLRLAFQGAEASVEDSIIRGCGEAQGQVVIDDDLIEIKSALVE